MKLVECVPNFSEGKDLNIIKQITDEIENTDNVKLLDVDPGANTNRTVVTFVGTPEAVVQAAFKAIKKASQLIDMSKHKGEHPRMGATDVCPFVPIEGITIEECNQLAETLAERVANELNIPVYLYEHSAKIPERKNLADIRKGEYEALSEKLKNPEFKPDFGEPIFNAKSGATVIGVRDFLVAYNVNINSKDRKKAQEIAFAVREKGRAKRDANGKIIRDENGKAIKIPGRLKSVKGIGWYIDEYGIAQISMNLTNINITMPHEAFEACREEANKLGLRVTGSELVGLIPKKALIEAGKYYLRKQGKSTGIPEKDIIFIAIKSLGLDELTPFDPKKKIIEYAYLSDNKDLLIDMKINDFADELSSDSPAPGGGSVAALNGVLASSLISMVSNLTHGKKGYEQHFDAMIKIGEKAQSIKDRLLFIIDKDTQAFNNVMNAMRMKKKTDDDKKKREKAIEQATKQATLVPFSIIEIIEELMDILKEITEKGNKNSISDAGVSAINAYVAAEGAYMNVLINIENINDKEFTQKIKQDAEKLLKNIENITNSIKQQVYKEINR